MGLEKGCASAALAEVKDWLAITSSASDAVLAGLLRASLDLFEAFTGQMALEATCEEVLPAGLAGWQVLTSRPVLAMTGMEGIPAEGARFAMAADAFEVDLGADGSGRVRVLRQGTAGRVAVRLSAGLSPDWDSLPQALRHGVIRLAAYQYRARDADAPASASLAAPPAAVAALWRPWRRFRLV